MGANSNSKFRHIVITGGSSGIGEALALYYAAPGIRLGLTGRDAGRLGAVAAACRARGADVEAKVICVTDRAGMEGWLSGLDDGQPIDLIIANAGISAGMGPSRDGEKPEQVRQLFDVNVTGVLNTIEPVLNRMTRRGRGHVALMSSLAGFRGWPGAPAYSATKAAVRAYGEGLRGALAGTGVNISVVCPGFVKSRMTDVNRFPMPLIMNGEKAARIIATRLARNQGRIAFPFACYFVVWFLMLLPDVLVSRLVRELPVKGESGQSVIDQ
jgi:short-subunit dehydrogenase